MTSVSEEEGSEELKKLNPQAHDFVPVVSPSEVKAPSSPPTSNEPTAEETTNQVEKPSAFLGTAFSRKKRRSRTKRKQYIPFPDLTKIHSNTSSVGAPASHKSFYDKDRLTVGSKVGKVDTFKNTVANKPIIPGYTGVGSRDKENAAPVYGHALTWKSDGVKAKDEYGRIRRNVRTVAPEQFVDRAKPSSEPANIFPRNVNEWQMFKSESVVDRMSELAEDMNKMGDMVKATENMEKDGIPRSKRVPKSAFGRDGKVFSDDLGPVLAHPTIWSEEFLKSDFPKASWPTRAELLEDGDQRENTQVRTRGGRHLPMPRYPQDPNESYVSFKDRMVIPQNPLDQVGPIYRNGSGEVLEPTPAEIDKANEEMNNDPTFEAQALLLLGGDLMDEIGRWQKPVVPAWQERQRQEQKSQQEVAEGLSMLRRGMSSMQVGGPSTSEAQSKSSTSGAAPHRNGISTNSTQPLSISCSHRSQPANAANMQFPWNTGARHGRGGASGQSVGNNSSDSGVDMRAWLLIGRRVMPGTNIGENFWMTPWGETVVYRDDW